MSAKEFQQCFTKKCDDEDVLQECVKEYSAKKTELLIDMIKHASVREICTG